MRQGQFLYCLGKKYTLLKAMLSGRNEGPKRLGLIMAHLQITSDMAMKSFKLNSSKTDPTALLAFYKNIF